MIVLELSPGEGVGPLHFGMSKAAIIDAAENVGLTLENHPFSPPAQDHFTESIIVVEYIDDTASFIGIAANDGVIAAMYAGKNLLDMRARDAVRHAMGAGGESPAGNEEPPELLRNLIMTFWDADAQYDYYGMKAGKRARKVWGQVGLGDDRYLAAIDAINSDADWDD